MSQHKNYVGLAKVAHIQFQASQAEMVKLLGREARLQEQLQEMDLSKKIRAAALEKNHDAAMIGGADIRWHRWVDAQRAKINEELALLRAQMTRCREKLVQTFGRDQATMHLANELEARNSKKRKRQDHYES